MSRQPRNPYSDPATSGPRRSRRVAVRGRFGAASRFFPAFVLLLLLLSNTAPAAADDVYLVHGEVFEDVVAERIGDQVRIRMAGGEMRISARQVERIETALSPYRRFLERRDELEADPSADAGKWLALAKDALRDDLPASARTAARRAADLDPDLSDLPPLMQRLGFLRDEVLGDWITRREHGRRLAAALPTGEAGDPAAQLAAREHREQRERQEAAWEARKAELAAAEARLAAEGARVAADTARLERTAAEAGTDRDGASVIFATPTPFSVVPGFVPTGGGHPHGPPPQGGSGGAPPKAGPTKAAPTVSGAPTINLYERQAGSLIPAAPRPPR